MTRKGRARLRALIQRVEQELPEIDAVEAIISGRVRIDGRVFTNPRSMVPETAAIALGEGKVVLRGEAKLAAALAALKIDVVDRVCVDLGASAGGFTRVLLREGARRVYAVDVGFGQLLGSLRQHPAVVNLERTNLGDLSTALVPEEVEVLTVDLSYLSLASALPQLGSRISIAPDADLVALIKPMFELRLPTHTGDADQLGEACRRATQAAGETGWNVHHVARSPVTGQAGAIEFLLHATRLA